MFFISPNLFRISSILFFSSVKSLNTDVLSSLFTSDEIPLFLITVPSIENVMFAVLSSGLLSSISLRFGMRLFLILSERFFINEISGRFSAKFLLSFKKPATLFIVDIRLLLKSIILNFSFVLFISFWGAL